MGDRRCLNDMFDISSVRIHLSITCLVSYNAGQQLKSAGST